MGSNPVVSHSGQFVVLHSSKGLQILDPIAGEVLASKEMKLRAGVTSFSPDGSKLVSVGFNAVQVVDFVSGILEADFAIRSRSKLSKISYVDWVDDELILVGSRSGLVFDLVDLKHQCGIWLYSMTNLPVIDGNGFVRATRDDTIEGENRFTTEIACLKLMHGEAEKVRSRAEAGDFDFSTDEGNVNFEFVARDAGEYWTFPDDAEKNLAERLKSIGYPITDSDDIPRILAVTDQRTTIDPENGVPTRVGYLRLGVDVGGRMSWEAYTANFASSRAKSVEAYKKHPFAYHVLPKTIRILELSGSANFQGQWKPWPVEIDGQSFKGGSR